MEKEIVVSVICMTFNQQKYVTQTLESLVAQKTEFPFEIIVHDDASTDRTPDIIREYAERYPELIRPLMREVNQFSQGIDIFNDYIVPRAKGTYIALCEGDDFWTSPNKLQAQYDAMMAHPECSMITHKVQGISEDGKTNLRTFPEKDMPEGIVKASEVIHRTLAYNEWMFHTTSYFVRKSMLIEGKERNLDFYLHPMYGDQSVIHLSAIYGDFYYLNELMSAYRIGSIGSTVRRDKDLAQLQRRSQRAIHALESFDQESGGIFHEDIETSKCRHQYHLAEATGQYKVMLSEEMKMFYDELPLSAKVNVHISSVFPPFSSLYYALRKMIKGY